MNFSYNHILDTLLCTHPRKETDFKIILRLKEKKTYNFMIFPYWIPARVGMQTETNGNSSPMFYEMADAGV